MLGNLRRMQVHLEAEHVLEEVPGSVACLTFAPPHPALFSGSLSVASNVDHALVVKQTDGLFIEGDPEAARSNRDLQRFRFHGARYSLAIDVRAKDPEAVGAVVRTSEVEGEISDGVARFVYRGRIQVKDPRGGVLEVLRGAVALTTFPEGTGWRLMQQGDRYSVRTDRSGEFSIELRFDAAIAEAEYKTELTSDEEHGLSEVEITLANGSSVIIDWELATHVEFQRATEIYKSFLPISQPPFVIKEGATETEVGSRDEMLNHILAAAKKDLHIQRYKGLGEMNPEQLWETTMDPEKRTLLQVKIDDAVETDEIFTVLMGDQVEPRRRFIEDNALEVKNLDI